MCGAMLMVSWLTGCGGSGHGPNTQGSKKTQHLKELDIRGGGHVKGRSYCASATAKRGRTSGTVGFTAQCVGLSKGGAMDLAVVLNPAKEVRHGAKISGYKRKLHISGATEPHSGRCSLKRQTLECSARAIGQVQIAGRFSVSPATECHVEVSVVNITVAACEKNYCEGGPVLNGLFRGRPRGCPQL
jgi:hypothetical protein